MVNKILYCATVDYHFKAFHLPYMKWFKEKGWEVHIASSGEMDLPYTDDKFTIPIQRSPFKRKNVEAYKQLRSLINENAYDIIHCHTPLGGVLTRLAAQKVRKQGVKVLYTAHGFHFCKGAPLINWLIYYPIEKYLARFTDHLITINQEDYQLAIKHRFKVGQVSHVHGVGVDTERFKPVDANKNIELKKSFGYQADDFLLFNASEFNKNKNQQFLLHGLVLIKEEVPNVKLLLAGEGPLLEHCRELAEKLGIGQNVDFLGFRKDIDQLVPICDVAVASSFREGLPVNIMEAMACGLPVIAVENRGHRELVQNNKNGWIVAHSETVEFANKVITLARQEDLKHKMGLNGRTEIVTTYSTSKILAEKERIYQSYMEEEQGDPMWAIQ